MQTKEFFDGLRQTLLDSDLTLPKISEKTGVTYQKLYRFRLKECVLTLEEAALLYTVLTGKTITLPFTDEP